jgi:hypothetical protein
VPFDFQPSGNEQEALTVCFKSGFRIISPHRSLSCSASRKTASSALYAGLSGKNLRSACGDIILNTENAENIIINQYHPKMRIKRLPLFIVALALILSSGYTMLYPNGAPAAKTGSPGDGSNCTECHGGNATTTAGLITTNIPAGGYVPGQTYQITATNPLTGTGKMGFEVSPQNAAGTQLGTLVAGSGSQLVSGTKYVTHTNANTTTNTWTFSWIAPAAGTGAVTFYGAFARNKPGPVTKSSLTVQEALAAPAAAGPITGPASICKNNSASYTVGVISGATSYVWSVPVGASISSGQGTRNVSVLFGPSALPGNVSVYGSNSGGNGAASNLAVAVNDVPATPAMPSGPAQVNIQNTATSDYTTSAGAASYVWQLLPAGAGTITGTTATAQVSWNAAFNGVAEISVKGQNTCGDGNWSPVKSVQVLNTTGIGEDQAVQISSAGTNGFITLTLNTTASEASVTLLDMTGKVLLSTSIAGQGTTTLDKHVNTGVYILLVHAGPVTVKRKVLVV